MTLRKQLEELKRSGSIPYELSDVIQALCEGAESVFFSLSTSQYGRYAEADNRNTSGDLQTLQDRFAHNEFLNRVSGIKDLRYFVSEECDEPLPIGEGNFSVSLDPFDGSKAYKYGIPAGSIFGVFEHPTKGCGFLEAKIVCSGFFVYSTRLELFLSFGSGLIIINPEQSELIKIYNKTDRFICVNISNYSSWEEGWRKFFDENLLSNNYERSANMRWFGSLATHTKTMILSGGIFAYPPDTRSNYKHGHLRMAYEAIPVAFLIESIGGRCTDGCRRILEKKYPNIHSRTPLVFGESKMVERLMHYLDSAN